MGGNQSYTIFDAESRSNRRCGSCTACCKLVPVLSLDKPANTRCKHQRVNKGCGVYRQPAMPYECGLWSCRWLVDTDTAGLGRPDRTHYVIDIMPDSIGMVSHDGTKMEVMCAQVWVDPAFPHAYQDPALRAWVLMIAERNNMPTMIRITGVRTFIWATPHQNGGMWAEKAMTQVDSVSGSRFVDQLRAGTTQSTHRIIP